MKKKAIKKASKNVKKKRISKYQMGGNDNSQYADNVIPGGYNPTTAHISSTQSNPALRTSLIAKQKELSESPDLSGIQNKSAQQTQAGDAAIGTALTAGKTLQTAAALKNVGKGAQTLASGAQAFKTVKTVGGTTANALKAGATAAGWAGPQAVGTAAAMLGKGIEKKYDDDDVTTMNAGETTGKMLKGAGYGASALGLAGSLGAFAGTNIWNPVGWAAGIGALGAGAIGLAKRNKGRKDVARQEGIHKSEQDDVNRQMMRQEANDNETTGYDYGNNLGMPSAQNRTLRQTGGVGSGAVNGKNLPGGEAVPLGGGAVEFKGNSHEEGGIMVDGNTEVEDKETADGVTMAGGKQKQYFFSDYLKHRGAKSFAQEHKEILQNGGQQSDIDALARIQEQAAGRDPNAVQVAQTGGPKQYQNAGFNTAEEEADALNLAEPSADTDLSLFEKMKQKYQTYQDGSSERQLNRAINGIDRDVPTSALLAGAGQMIPAAYAFKHKEKPVEQLGRAGRISAPALDRVNFNAERSSNAAGTRAMNKAIDNTGGGPASVIARMAAHSKQQTQDMQIASAEARANTAISSQEAQMRMSASSQNVANDMRVDAANTQVRENQRISEENTKKEALDVGFKNLAGINSDILKYKASEREARAYGAHGIYERDKLRTSLKGKLNSKGEPYSDAEIARIVNQRFPSTEEKKD